jgi:hypothetical protein
MLVKPYCKLIVFSIHRRKSTNFFLFYVADNIFRYLYYGKVTLVTGWCYSIIFLRNIKKS